MALNEPKSTEPQLPVDEAPHNIFYRTVWRWHFYAGLFVIPFMLILATTGIIYLFKPQLDTVTYHDLLFVQQASETSTDSTSLGATPLPYAQQVQAAQSAYPMATVTKFVPSLEVTRSAEVIVETADARNLAVFIDPYTGQVLGTRDEERNLQAIARKIH
ncbi:MAG: putative iron-regulated membrane protein [Phormidesmis priestleyi Ana]|uniref:Putative iron-regulated membrane protein n=1 Tax=Phormidesmis priestleyi Ana TaxID=1666911 RepID=A0A0P8BUT4_9CYAN|nr:MAG: putative iron-regulated membrane protein [Phormidesmis priestleyi Ana]